MGKLAKKIKKSQAVNILDSVLRKEPLLKKESEEELERYIQLRANMIVSELLYKQREAIEANAIRHTFMTMNALYALSLNSLHGFGKKRTNALIESVRNQFTCLKEGYVSSLDIANWCIENEIEYKNIYSESVQEVEGGK